MNVKLGDLVASEQALGELAQANVSARMSFTLALVLKEVTKHLEAKRTAHQKLLEKFGTPKANKPGMFDLNPETREAFETEYKDLLDTDVELVGIGKIKASAIETEGVKLSGAEMLALEWLLVQDVQPLFEV